MNIGINARLLIKNRLEGIGWHAYEIISRLVALRPQDTFYLFYDRENQILVPKGDNVKVISLFPPSRHPLLIWIWIEYAVRKACIKNDISLFYSPEVIMPATLNIPCIITVHDLSPIVLPDSLPWAHRLYYQNIIKRNLKLADRVITVSNFSKQEIISHYAVPASDIEVIYNAAREIFKPVEEQERRQIKERYTLGKPFFIYVGSIHKRKNIDKVIAAFDVFRQQYATEHKLILAGKFMGLSAEASEAIKNSAYQEDIIGLGYMTEDQLALLLGSADALINLSEYEGFGMPIVEAFASGVPVVAADKSSYPEIGGKAVLLVNPSQPLDVAVALQRCIKERGRLVEAGYVEIVRFDWDTAASSVSTLIQHYQ
ncbi:MAG: glycosyltransferase family 1 protein [Saprospiraceae bacterium]